MTKKASAPALRFGRYDYANFSLFGFYAGCSLAIPIALVPLAQALDFPLEAGGMGLGGALQLGRCVPMVMMMLLCNYLAQRLGHRRSLGLASLCMGIGILSAAFSQNYWMLLIALIVSGLGEGTVEGLGTPIVQDLHAEEQPGRYINFTHGFWSVGVLICVLLSGALLACGVPWRWVVGGIGVCALSPALIYLLPSRKKIPAIEGIGKNASAIDSTRKMLQVLKSGHFWLFWGAMFVAGGGEFCLTFWCASYLQLEFGTTAWLGGVGTGCFALGMMLGRALSGVFVPQKRLKELIIWTALAATVISCIFPFIVSVWSLLGMLLFSGLLVAPFWPSVQSYCVDRMPKLDSTTLFILLSCAGVPGCGFFTVAMGMLGDRVGLRNSFYLVPFCFVVLCALIAWDGYVLTRREGEAEAITQKRRKLRKKRLMWCAVVLVLLLGGILAARMWADHIIFQPPHRYRTPEAYQEQMRFLEIPGTAERIAIIYYPAPENRPTVLFSHGNADALDRIDFRLEGFRNHGYGVLAYDYEGYGDSSGTPSEHAVYRDADRVYQFLTEEEGIPSKDIIIYGHSVGSGPSCYLAEKYEEKALVLEAPFASTFQVMLPGVRLFGDRFPNIDRIDKINAPLLILHGKLDVVINYLHGKKLYERAQEPKQMLSAPRGGHCDLWDHIGDEMWLELESFH